MNEIPMNVDRYSKAIDGLRAIAVIAVIFNHFSNSLLPSGYLGVDIFFVISGYVITNSLVKRKESNAKVFFLSFYKRRIKRLIPALLFCFSITAVLISFFCLDPKNYILTGLSSIPGFSNMTLYFDSIDYWGESSHYNPFTHTWSLGVEEQFYLIFPLSIWLLTFGKWSVLNLKKIEYFLLFTCLISLIGFIYFQKDYPMMSYFLMPFRLWEIGIGGLLYIQIKKTNGNFLKGIINRVPLFAILLVIIGIFFIPKDYGLYNTVFIVILTCMLIIKIKLNEEHKQGILLKSLTNNLTVYIGKISYSLYLWHWVIIVVSKWTIGITIYSLPILLILIISLSTFSYHFIEKPLRHSSWKKSLTPKFILLPMIGITLFFAYSVKYLNKNHLYLGREVKFSTVLPDTPENFHLKCSTIRTIGNSHSLHIIPMLEVITNKLGIDLVHEKHPDYILIPNGDRKDLDKLSGVINSLNQNDILVLSSRNRLLYQIPYLNGKGDKWVNHKDVQNNKGYGLDIWLEELDSIITKANAKGINIVLFMPNVEFDSTVAKPDYSTPQWFRIQKQKDYEQLVSRDFLNSRFSDEFYSEVKKRATENLNFFLFDPLPLYCPDSENCSNYKNGIVLFKDTNHLSEEGSLLMLEAFYNFLMANDLL